LIWLFGKGQHAVVLEAVVLENVALRQQIAVYKRKQKHPRLARRDRWFWIVLSVTWKDWRRALCIVHPDTVVCWQRERFHRFWANLSKRSATAGRPPVSPEVRTLIRTLAQSNPLWRAPRIHGELQKLGIEVSERTVSRLLRTIRRPPAQTWKTFLRNHISDIVAIDFFTVPTVRLRVLFVFLVIEHGRGFRSRIQMLGVSEVVTAPRSPWQNAFVERLIGSIRRECLDHVIILNQRHLRRLLKIYLMYYHRSRTHLALAKDAPEPRAIMRHGALIAIPQVGGLHHRNERRAA
jgi:hypothetical protein